MNLGRALRLARLARDADLGICLALHYSDSWADPTHQAKPAAWSALPFDSLCQTVYRYTRSVIEALSAQRTPPAIVQVGNEITNGVLWAACGQAATCEGQLFPCDVADNLPASDGQWPLFARLS